MNSPPIYQIRQLQQRYDSGFMLNVSALDIERGGVLALIGPTGAGKSTLLRLLSGCERPIAGEIRFDNVSLLDRDLPLATRRRIGMVHQRPLLLSGSVEANVTYGMRLRQSRFSLRESTYVRGAIDGHPKILDQFGLATIAKQPSLTLSGGQSQLVAIARAVAFEPEVLLLDEPTAHLDPAHVALVENALRQYQHTTGATLIWTTHNLFQARRVADRAALLLNGEIVEAGPTEQLFAQPADSRTADFVEGRMIY